MEQEKDWTLGFTASEATKMVKNVWIQVIIILYQGDAVASVRKLVFSGSSILRHILETNYLNTDMCKSESSQSLESRAWLTDFSKVCSKPRAFSGKILNYRYVIWICTTVPFPRISIKSRLTTNFFVQFHPTCHPSWRNARSAERRSHF